MDGIYVFAIALALVALAGGLFVRYLLNYDLDEQALSQLRKQGKDLRAAHKLVFRSEFADALGASQAAETLNRDGYATVVKDGLDGRKLLLASKAMTPELRRLKAVRERMYSIVRPRRGIYEGWDIETPAGNQPSDEKT